VRARTEPCGSSAAIVTGESMLPEFQEGDLIIIDPEVVPKPGDFVIAKLDLQVDGAFMKYRPRGTGESGQPIIELVPLNEDWPTQTINAGNPGHIIGKSSDPKKLETGRPGEALKRTLLNRDRNRCS